MRGLCSSASSGPKIKGKANVSDMLYGRPINDDIISIHSINDNSGRVVFSGKVFLLRTEILNLKNWQGISPYNNGYYRITRTQYLRKCSLQKRKMTSRLTSFFQN